MHLLFRLEKLQRVPRAKVASEKCTTLFSEGQAL
jgi:hypothetical protein